MDPRRAPLVTGSRNLRDLGGYETADGSRIRWGMLYRSGSLGGIGEEGVQALNALGLHSICDLRTTRERVAEPYHWAERLGISCWSRDYETSFGELRRLMEAELPSGDEARAAMLAGYRRLPFEQAPAFAELFRRLKTGALPLLFNCSAGKDRAGTAAALVLTMVGVPRETVIADYVLTDSFVDLEAKLTQQPSPGSLLARQHKDVVRAILSCEPAYMNAALDAVGAGTPRFDDYLQDSLGVGPDDRAIIAARLLAPAELD